MVVARHLAIAGASVELVLAWSRGDAPASEEARTQLRIVGAMALRTTAVEDAAAVRLAADSIRAADVIVDGLYGTGLTRAPAGLVAELISEMNAASAPTLALDIPSGLDADSGLPLGPCVEADVTATFVAPKLGFLDPESRRFTGDIRVVGIGAPAVWPLRRTTD
jgi:NAD(P)H-hydrate epimerase